MAPLSGRGVISERVCVDDTLGNIPVVLSLCEWSVVVSGSVCGRVLEVGSAALRPPHTDDPCWRSY